MNAADIKIGMRVREDLGDLNQLAQSIVEIGLLHPVVVRPDGTLIAGMRRFAAMTEVLGWTEIPTRTVDNLTDAVLALRAEGEENAQRKDLTPNEAVKLGNLLEPLEREAARRRRTANLPAQTENFSIREESEGRAIDHVAAAVGMSRPTYEKARKVVQAAEEKPPEIACKLPAI